MQVRHLQIRSTLQVQYMQIRSTLQVQYLQIRLSFFFSNIRHASTQCRTPAPRGMASQHLRTFERVPAAYSLFAGTVPAEYSLFVGTVPAFNLFQMLKQNCNVKYNSYLEFWKWVSSFSVIIALVNFIILHLIRYSLTNCCHISFSSSSKSFYIK